MHIIDPLEIIKSDHEKIKKLFNEYAEMSTYDDKLDQASKIAEELAIHMEMEEEYFYPPLRESSDDAENAVSESINEHEEIKKHISQAYEAVDEVELDEHISKMEEIVLEHVTKEETALFSIAEDNIKNDFTKMAAAMNAYKLKAKGKIIAAKIREKF